MNELKLWETKLNKDYTYLTTLEDYFNYLDESNKSLIFILKDKYENGQTPRGIIDEIALRNNYSVIYTDKDHPIAVTKNHIFPTYIDPTFFNENRQKFVEYEQNKIIKANPTNRHININDFSLTDEIFNKIINDETLTECTFYYIETEGKTLTEEQIQKIKEKHLNFYISGKSKNYQISSNKVIHYHTISDLKNIESLNIKLPISTEEINNFIYINDSAIITINESSSTIKNEDEYFKQIQYIFNILKKHNKNYNIKITVDNREKLRKSNILKNLPSNINLAIENDLNIYDIETYNHEEEKLEKLIAPIRNSNLSPFEKYIAAYNIAKQFKKYKENPNAKDESRYLRYILDNEYIVCVGFSKILNELLDRLNIPCKSISVGVDTSYGQKFTAEEKPLDIIGHARNLVELHDEKYNIHGIYLADATWDNLLEKDVYLNSLLTFDKKKEARRLESLSDEDLLLDFHNINEFNQKINYYLKQKCSLLKKSDFTNEEIITKAYKTLYQTILEYLRKLNYEKFSHFYKEYHEGFDNFTITLDKLEPLAKNMLTEYANYIIPISNQNIPIATILKAATEVKRTINGYSDKDIAKWLNETTEFNKSIEPILYPYQYDPNNQTEAYLEDRKTSKSK